MGIENPKKTLVIQRTVAPLTGIIDYRPIIRPTKAGHKAVAVTIHWPDGCNALVDVAAGFGSDQRLLPDEDYVALNNATVTWPLDRPFPSDILWGEIRNGDAVNAHTISIIISYEEAVD